MEENINITAEGAEETPIVQEEPLVTPAYEMAAEPKKKKKGLKFWLITGISALVAIAAVVLVLVFFVFNTYKTPIKLMEKTANAKKASTALEKYGENLNGFCEDEYQEIMKVLKKTDYYDDAKENFEETIEENKDEYGSNYKAKYKIVEKEKIDKDELRDYRDELRDAGEELLAEYEDMDPEDIAYELDISESQAKKLLKAWKSVAKTMKKAKVTEGYTLTVELKITGSELDEAEEDEMEINVYKINGRWVSDVGLMVLAEVLYLI